MTVLRSTVVTLELKKCDLFTNTVTYLGHIIRPVRLMSVQAQVESLVLAKELFTHTGLCSLLGLVIFYRRFIPNYWDIAAPYNALLRKVQPTKPGFITLEQTAASQSLIRAVTMVPILAFVLADAESSNFQVVCALYQTTAEEEGRPTGYWSRTLMVHKRNYSVLQEKCLTVVWVLAALRPYVMGTPLAI